MSSLSSPDAALRASGPRTDLYYVLSAGLLWGTGGLAGSLLGQVAALPPLAVATYRLAGGGLTVLAVLAVTGRLPRLRRAGLVRVLSVGVLTATYQACYFAAVAMTSLAVATVVAIGAAPVLVLTAEAVGGRRRPGSASLVAIGLALLGLALLLGTSGHPLTRAGGGSPALGVLLALGAAAGFGALALIGRRPVAGLDGPATIGLGFTAGGALLAVATVVAGALTGGPASASAGWGSRPRRPRSACSSTSVGCRPRWPTGCSSSACAASRPVRRRWSRCSNRLPRRCSGCWCSASGWASVAWWGPACSARRRRSPEWAARRRRRTGT
jgi:drug/metabolite transporter, DME family